jgi:hypothetical protein
MIWTNRIIMLRAGWILVPLSILIFGVELVYYFQLSRYLLILVVISCLASALVFLHYNNKEFNKGLEEEED